MIGVGVGIPFNRTSFGGAPSFTNTKSLLFDGVDEWLNCGSPTFVDSCTNFSWSFWVKWNSTGLKYTAYYSNTTADTGGFGFLKVSNETIQMSFNSSTGNYVRTIATVSTGVWYHVLVTYDGSGVTNQDKCKIYLNGSLETTSTGGTIPSSLSATFSTSHILKLGRLGYTGAYTDCYIDEMAFWNSTLNGTDATNIYNSGSPSDLNDLGTQPIHWWRMGDGDTYPTIIDHTGGNNGTMTNQEVGDIVTDTP